MNHFVTDAATSPVQRAAKRCGFTLVELLVVIVVIAILVALLVPAIGSAMTAAKNGQIGVEIASMASAMKGYRAENLAYPPDFAGDDTHDIQVALKAHLSRKYRNRKPNDIPTASMNQAQLDAMFGVAALYPDLQAGAIGLDPSEALVFWLSGQSPSATHPVTGPGNRKPLFEFDKSRLRDADQDGWPEYYPRNGEQPYVYLQTYTTLNAADLTSYASFYPAPISTGAVLHPYKSETGFADPEGFQIICAGLDNEFGAEGGVYPTALGYTQADQDNITNFSEGKTLQDAIP